MRRLGLRASFALCLAAAILSASAASARTERFRWTQANASSVNNFRLYYGLSSGNYSNSLNTGVPAKDSTGAYYFDIVVADSDTIYATVTAWSGTLESLRSNEVSRAGTTGGTTPPPPPPPPSGPSAAISGLALWNAQTNAAVDSNFVNGDTIPDGIRQCAAIEAIGNAYLARMDSAGSVSISIDGGTARCENSLPFLSAGDGTCDARLAIVGGHTITARPYDGDNCSGTAGTSVSISFTVGGAPPSSTLGAPGQPVIVP